MTFSGTLLPYQPEAVIKMIERQKMLVAYDLGLGKTVITIAVIEQLMDDRQDKRTRAYNMLVKFKIPMG